MELNEYQVAADKTAIYPGRDEPLGLYYASLGLVNEAGEVAGKVKKVIRDGGYDPNTIADELGDVLWYAAVLASEIGFTLDEVAERNLSKLSSRKDRGVLQGSGDNR
jgi:NTP pyrophosphatase (non-canonical NTP hydrolase)